MIVDYRMKVLRFIADESFKAMIIIGELYDINVKGFYDTPFIYFQEKVRLIVSVCKNVLFLTEQKIPYLKGEIESLVDEGEAIISYMVLIDYNPKVNFMKGVPLNDIGIQIHHKGPYKELFILEGGGNAKCPICTK